MRQFLHLLLAETDGSACILLGGHDVVHLPTSLQHRLAESHLCRLLLCLGALHLCPQPASRKEGLRQRA